MKMILSMRTFFIYTLLLSITVFSFGCAKESTTASTTAAAPAVIAPIDLNKCGDSNCVQ